VPGEHVEPEVDPGSLREAVDEVGSGGLPDGVRVGGEADVEPALRPSIEPPRLVVRGHGRHGSTTEGVP
jgi:hypothetical protein